LIEKATVWIKTSLNGEKRKTASQAIVNYRRKLNRKKFALASNPAAAVYGESQVGKSYLISSLLSEEGKPFGIIDETGAAHNFIEKINPPGGGTESTSLVSRFSVNYKSINPKYPIKAILLSPADIVMVLCDSFYSDIKAVHELTLKTEEINTEIEAMKTSFQGKQTRQTVFGEDDVLDIRDYFTGYLPQANNVLNSCFFDEISLLISKTKPDEWQDIFSLLWNRNKHFTTLFARLIAEYQKLNFAECVYLPLESVLYSNGTLLDVKRLKEIYFAHDKIESEYRAETKALFFSDGRENEITVAKSYLCALAAELVFSQPETLLEGKQFLEKIDLLDFPGARSRLTLPESLIETEIIPALLLRGKVAYLFNKYSECEKINILIFCAKHEQAAQRAMPEMLNKWINKTVGETPEKREEFINKSEIPPLFIVETFFNVNLMYDPQLDNPNDNTHFNYRWNQRFDITLADQLLNTESYKWFDQWTTTNACFQNIFLLRDFEKSENISHIFEGYHETKQESEVKPKDYPEFKTKLRQSFIEYPFVKRHFEDPAESWDRAASVNEDGTQLIIAKLNAAAAAEKINVARMTKMREELTNIAQAVIAELCKYFYDNDEDKELQRAQEIAGDVTSRLTNAFSADGIKLYGQLMKELMLEEASVLQLYNRIINANKLVGRVNMDQYGIYRMQVPVMENDTVDTYFERLCVHFAKTTDERKQKFRAELEENRIDLEELVHGNVETMKNNAQLLAEALLEYWLESITQNDKHAIRKILAPEGSAALTDIMEMFQKLFKKLNIAKRIAEKIHHYVEEQNETDPPYEIVADISAELLNKCINTVGFEYFDEPEIEDLRQANETNNLGLVLDWEYNPEEESMEDLFMKIEERTNPEIMKPLPNYRNYLLWSDRLKIGFISVCNIPIYDVPANEKLGTIIEECKNIKY
jgi:hypothetical protein